MSKLSKSYRPWALGGHSYSTLLKDKTEKLSRRVKLSNGVETLRKFNIRHPKFVLFGVMAYWDKRKHPEKSPGKRADGKPKSFGNKESVKVPAKKGEKFRKKNGELQKSNWGRRNPPVDMSNWRRQLDQRRVKFDDVQKGIYLDELARHGRRGDAAEAACVTPQTVINHINNDPDFAEAVELAENSYRDKFVGHAMTLAYEGIEINRYNRNGELVESRRDFPVRLIEMELKRIEPGYNDRRTIDLNETRRGVLVVPHGQKMEDWAAERGVEIIDSEAEEVK